MPPTTAPDSLAALLRDRMRAQADLFFALTSHPTLVGSGREGALSEVIRQLIPRRFEVLSGTIALTNELGQPKKTSHQLDVIVADTFDYPTLLRLGDTAVVLPPAVRAIVEVKSDLARGEVFLDALRQICRAQYLLGGSPSAFTALYCFGAPTKHRTLRQWIADAVSYREECRAKGGRARRADRRLEFLTVASELSAASMPTLILSDDGAAALKAEQPDGRVCYRFVRAEDELRTLVILLDQLVQRLATGATGEPASVTMVEALRLFSTHLGVRLHVVSDVPDLEITDPKPTAPAPASKV
jgi:hypothetical protein